MNKSVDSHAFGGGFVYTSILIATDGSEHTANAVRHGITLAKTTGARVTALFVIDATSFSTLPAEVAWDNIHSILRREGEKATEYVKKEGKRVGVAVTTAIREGVPADVIVAESENYDLVVTGTLGRSGLRRLLIGSVAERVIKMAKCPVLVVKSDE